MGATYSHVYVQQLKAKLKKVESERDSLMGTKQGEEIIRLEQKLAQANENISFISRRFAEAAWDTEGFREPTELEQDIQFASLAIRAIAAHNGHSTIMTHHADNLLQRFFIKYYDLPFTEKGESDGTKTESDP